MATEPLLATEQEHAELMEEVKEGMKRKILDDLANSLNKILAPKPYGMTPDQLALQRERINADADVAKLEARRRYGGERSVQYREAVRRIDHRRTTLLRYHADMLRLVAACNEARQGIYEALKRGDTAGANRIAHAFIERPAIAP